MVLYQKKKKWLITIHSTQFPQKMLLYPEDGSSFRVWLTSKCLCLIPNCFTYTPTTGTLTDGNMELGRRNTGFLKGYEISMEHISALKTFKFKKKRKSILFKSFMRVFQFLILTHCGKTVFRLHLLYCNIHL